MSLHAILSQTHCFSSLCIVFPIYPLFIKLKSLVITVCPWSIPHMHHCLYKVARINLLCENMRLKCWILLLPSLSVGRRWKTPGEQPQTYTSLQGMEPGRGTASCSAGTAAWKPHQPVWKLTRGVCPAVLNFYPALAGSGDFCDSRITLRIFWSLLFESLFSHIFSRRKKKYYKSVPRHRRLF